MAANSAPQLTTTKLDFWIKNHQNVLFIGRHGVGKTAIVKEAFDRHGLKWRYFSASTMDPWVDFVGVPKEQRMLEAFEVIKELSRIDEGLALEWITSNWKMKEESARKIVAHVGGPNHVSYLKLVRPRDIATGDIEALFFDEFNRSPKKIRNAVMELLQFKSINGEPFPNLKLIWAAVNPFDEEQEVYDVERLDPAQEDRFHIKIGIPYRPNGEWFKKRYGERIAKAALQWWEELTEEEKDKVSPRRLEYALNIFELRGDMRDALPQGSNVSKLTTALNTGPITDKLQEFINARDTEAAQAFLANENQFASAMKYIPKTATLMDFFLPLVNKEKLAALMNDDDNVCRHIIVNSDKVPKFMAVCKEILRANANQKLTKKIRRALTENQQLSQSFANADANANTQAEFHANKKPQKAWSAVLADVKAALPTLQQAAKMNKYETLAENIPDQMTADEALLCLELLSNIFSRSFSSTITSKPVEKLVPIVNQCIREIHRHTGYDWQKIVATHGTRFKDLLEKIKLAGLSNRLYYP